MSDKPNKWDKPTNPPPQLFTGQKERDLVKGINDELQERVIGQKLLYYPVDVEKTNFDDVYGEAQFKVFYDPILVHGRVFWNGIETSFEDSLGPDKKTSIDVHFQKRRISEDQKLFVREGDYLLWGNIYYEIHTTGEPEELWGQPDERFAVVAKCIKARQGIFDG